MSESESPKRGRKKKGADEQPEPVSQGEGPVEAAPTPPKPAQNPWLSPADDTAPRRSARMDDILRQRRPSPGSPLGLNRNALWLWGTLGVVSAWLLSTSIHVLAPNERGIVTTLGRYAGTIGPGTGFTLPWPIQSVTRREVGKEQVLLLPDQEAETLMLTRDGELIDVRTLVRWRVGDLKAFSYALPDGEAALRRLADSAVRAAVAELTFDELRGGKRQNELQQRVAQRLQRVLDAWGAGISVGGVELTAANPPAKLGDTFKKIEKANQDAGKNRDAAIAYAARVRYSAEAEAKAFDKAYDQYRIAPGITRERIYYETIERILRNNQVVIGGNGGGVTLPSPPAADKAAGQPGGQ